MRFRYLPEAHRDVLDAAGWYETKYTGLGEKFEDAVEAAVQDIVRRPLMRALWPGKPGKRGIRRYLMRKTKRQRRHGDPDWPYKIAYEVKDDVVVIIAVPHEKQRPFYWLKRTR